MTLTTAEDRFRRAVAADVGLPFAELDRTHTAVVPEADRAGSGMAVAYHVGQPTLIRTDPDLAEALADLVDRTRGLDLDDFQTWAARHNWDFVDGGDLHVVDEDNLGVSQPQDGLRLVELNRKVPGDLAKIRDLLDASGPEDADEAEIDFADLDPHIVGVTKEDGSVIGMASGRQWECDPTFDDIGVLTHPDHRGRGAGAAAVSRLCVESFERGRLPLYRCNWSRVASKALAMSLGFRLVGQLSAVAMPTS